MTTRDDKLWGFAVVIAAAIAVAMIGLPWVHATTTTGSIDYDGLQVIQGRAFSGFLQYVPALTCAAAIVTVVCEICGIRLTERAKPCFNIAAICGVLLIVLAALFFTNDAFSNSTMSVNYGANMTLGAGLAIILFAGYQVYTVLKTAD